MDSIEPPDAQWGGFRAWIGGSAVLGLALLLGALTLAGRAAPLPWFTPSLTFLMAATYAVVAALALLDAGCRLHGRSLAIAVAAVALATVSIPRALTFPGVIPGGIPWAGPQTASMLVNEIIIATPALLTAALMYRGGRLLRPRRAVLTAIGLGLATGVALTVLGAALAPVLPPTVVAGQLTVFSRVLALVALVPNAAAVSLVVLGFRGDRRVAPSIAGALTLLLLQELSTPLAAARFEPMWYAQNLLVLSPALVLLVGQLGLYRASVRAERERSMETAALYAATRAMAGSADPSSVLASIPKLANAALQAVSGRAETRCSLVEFEGDRARIVAEHDPLGVVQVGTSFALAEHPALIAVSRDRRAVTGELTNLGPAAGSVIRTLGVRRGAYAPVLRGATVVGALTLGLRSRRPFEAAELRLLDGLASVASLALTSRRRETLRRLQYSVARTLSVADSMEEAVPVVLAQVGEALDCQVGNLWVHHPRDQVLIRAQGWHSHDLDVTDFIAESDALRVRPGQGLPGRVWASGEPETVADITRLDAVARGRAISALGLRGALAVPIVIDGLCTGVVEVFSRRPRPPGEEIIDVLVDIGRQLGQFMARKRAELSLHESAERLAEMATTDRLTGLKNRREFEKVLGVIPRQRFAILAIDVDGLKPINDQFGHEAGDVVLQAVAMTLRALVRSWDVVARVGGDEFAVVLTGAAGEEAATVAERMRTAMHSVTVLQGRARISVGWAAAPAGADPSATWRAADEVLYRAKRSGRDRVEGTEARDAEGAWGAHPGASRDAAMLTEVFERGTVDVVYQPIVDLRDGTVAGYEALARPAGTGPDASVSGLFDAARRLGRIRDLDWLCRRAALREARGLPAGATIFVNVSAAAFLDPVHEVDQLLLLLRWVGRSPTDVVLELTEQETIPDLERLQLIAGLYREHGVRFAADDVGDGHSTLEVLAALDPEFIKVARSLSTTATRPGSRAAIRAAQAFARDSGATVIAEGVETPEVARELLALGITIGQGHHLALPAPAPRQVAI
ncbi:MAG TPA: EAL domain-containing protein [Candidatus Dormibacteraeota bacterium]